ncbi:MAG: hypothetical protein KDA21_09375 [Phycisphaerales bacterium]|nr:hypothetical protein [Phycisphaerales bacterium]
MDSTVLRFSFDDGVDFTEAELTLHLALLAAEGVFGPAEIRVNFAYRAVPEEACIEIEGGTFVNELIARMFVSLLLNEFGREAFKVRRMPTMPVNFTTEVAA